MSQILKTIVSTLVLFAAWIMKVSISLLIRVTTKPQDRQRRIAEVNRNYNIMINGAKMLKK